VNAGVVTGEELAASLGPVTQSAKAAGVSLDELGAMIVGVTKEGGPAAQNINNLNNMLQKITTKEAQKGFNDLGVATKTATGEFRPTIEVMRDLKTRLEGMTESARANALQTIFPDAQARLGAMTIMSQIDAVDAALATNQAATGSAASAYEKMSATFNSQSKLLVNGLTAILTTVGAMLLPMLTPLITAFSQSLPGAFNTAKAALSDLMTMFSGGGSGSGALNGILSAMGLGPESIAMIDAAILQIGDAWRTLQQVFANEWSPDASIAPLVNALGQVAVFVRDQVLPAFTSLFTFLGAHTEILAGIAASFLTLLAAGPIIGVVTGIAAAFAALLSPVVAVAAVIGLLTAAWVGNWGGIQEITFAAIAAISAAISTGLAAIQAFWDAHGPAIMAAAATAWEGVKTAVEVAIGVIGALLDGAAALWAGGLDGAWAAILGAVDAAWAGIGASVQGGLDAIGAAMQTAWDAITGQVSAAQLAIQAAIKAVWDLIPADIQADLILIANHLLVQGAAWLVTMQTTALAIQTAIVTTFGEIATFVSTWASTTIMAPLLALIGTATAAATETGTGIWTAITTKLDEVVAAMGEFAGDVLASLRGLVGTASAAAASIGQGIIEGIRGAIMAGAQSIASAAANVVRRALEAAKAAIGVDSPSKDFRDEVGKPIVQGVMVGLQKMQPALDSMLGGLVQPPSMGMSAPRPPVLGYGGGTVINVTVQGSLIRERELDAVVGRAVGNNLRRNGRLGSN